MRGGDGFDEIKPKFINICVGLKLANEEVCTGIINVYGPEVLPVVNITSIGKHPCFCFEIKRYMDNGLVDLDRNTRKYRPR